MLEFRLKASSLFEKKPMPRWGADLSDIDFDNIKYFVRSTEKQAQSWEDLPADIKNTYDKLGIPEAEKARLVAGVAAQYESEVVYHQIREDLEAQGVIFLDTDTGLREHPELFREYFGSVIPSGDNKFSALNSAVWSGGSFIYVPPGVRVDIPLQAYFRINTENMGQFERTLIIVDEGAYVHYVEGCTAPIYKSDSLHSAVVEIIVKKGGRCRYTTIQNWSNNVYNLVTKRAKAFEGATMEWVDGNLGSKVTMKYPAVLLMGEHAKGEVLSIAFAGEGQHQDAGAKMTHLAPHTSSTIISKSVARGGGRTSYRGLVRVNPNAHHSRSTVKCDALLVDTISRSDTYPYVDVRTDDVSMGHEATVSKVSGDQLFYLMSRGLDRGRGHGECDLDGRRHRRRAGGEQVVEDGHADDEPRADLVDDERLRRVGDGGVDLDTAVHRAGVHDLLPRSQAGRRHPPACRVLAQARHVVGTLLHALPLHAQDVDHVRVGDGRDVVRDGDAGGLDAARQQRRRADEHDVGADQEQRLDIRAGDARVQDVSDDGHVHVLEPPELGLDRVEVEQRLGRVLVLAVPGVDHVRGGVPDGELRRADLRVPHDEHVRVVGAEREQRVLE